MYTIIDIETTGLGPFKEKITEIAVYAFDGQKVIDKSISLVNHERPIPYFITRMTGITNEMVEECINPYQDNRDIQIIIKGFLNRNKVEKTLPL